MALFKLPNEVFHLVYSDNFSLTEYYSWIKYCNLQYFQQVGKGFNQLRAHLYRKEETMPTIINLSSSIFLLVTN